MFVVNLQKKPITLSSNSYGMAVMPIWLSCRYYPPSPTVQRQDVIEAVVMHRYHNNNNNNNNII